jgi:hypothetical protein
MASEIEITRNVTLIKKEVALRKKEAQTLKRKAKKPRKNIRGNEIMRLSLNFV